jgi:hypothetical protein
MYCEGITFESFMLVRGICVDRRVASLLARRHSSWREISMSIVSEYYPGQIRVAILLRVLRDLWRWMFRQA